MEKTHTLLISDIHLGSENCHAKLLLGTLQGFDYERIIVIGDLYERGSFICDEQFEIVKYLRANRKKLIYIDGNHDPSLRRVPDRVLGVKAIRKFKWQLGAKRFYAIHGHQFDRFCFIFSEPLIDKMISCAILFLQRMDVRKFHVGRWIDNLHISYSRHVATRACNHARRRKADYIICGHTHRPGIFSLQSGKTGRAVEYVNCGSWVDDPCSFVTIDADGNLKLHFVSASNQPSC